MSTNDVNKLKRINAYLKQENEKLKRNLKEQEDLHFVYKDLKLKYRELHESHKRQS